MNNKKEYIDYEKLREFTKTMFPNQSYAEAMENKRINKKYEESRKIKNNTGENNGN